MRIAVVGIHTEVGKTVVSAILTEALDAYYWKAVQCGPPYDREWVQMRISKKNRCLKERYCFTDPISPHLAARNENVVIKAVDLQAPICDGPLVIDGTGGILAPLNETERWLDAALSWNCSFVLVHKHYLGCFNHFYLTVAHLKQLKVPLTGIVFNGPCESEKMLLDYAETICLGRIQWQPTLTKEFIQQTAKKWCTELAHVIARPA